MKRLLPALAILAFLILPQAAQAQVFFEQQIPKIDKIFVVYENHVEDDCLPSSSILKVEAELILRRSHIAIAEKDDGTPHVLLITVFGSAADGSWCLGDIDMEVFRAETLADGTVGYVVAAAMGWKPIFGRKPDFQNAFREAVNHQVTALANEILKARANR